MKRFQMITEADARVIEYGSAVTLAHNVSDTALNITSGTKQRYCDGVSRRSFLQVGAMGVGGLTLASLLYQFPDFLGAQRHVDGSDAERGECVEYGVDDGWRGSDSARFARALHAQGIDGRRSFDGIGEK